MKVLKGIFVVTLVLFIASSSYLLFVNLHHKMEPKAATGQININLTYAPLPEDWQEQVRKLFNVKHTLEFCDMSKTINGNVILFTRRVKIDKDISDVEKVIAYAHELTHLKFYTINETFTEYKSTIILYESNVPYFQYAALTNVNYIVNCHAYQGSKYDCGEYLLKYFKNI